MSAPELPLSKAVSLPAKKWPLLVIFELALWGMFTFAMLRLWDSWLIPGPHGTIHWVGMDFVSYWVGIRAMFSGLSPYSAGTAQVIQSTLLGGPPAPGGDPMLFVYPAWIFLPLAPLALLPLKWAAALWTGFLLLGMLHLIGVLAFRWSGGNLRRMVLWALVLVIGSLPYLSIAVTKGQLSLLSLGGLFLSIWLVSRVSPGEDQPAAVRMEMRRPHYTELLAGVFLALAILKPTVTLVPAMGMLLWALMKRKFYFIAGFIFFLGVLSLASFLAIGNWIPAYRQLLTTAGGASVLWSLSFLAWPWNGLYALLFLGITLFAIIRLIRGSAPSQWFSAAILAGVALFPMRWIYDLLLAILIPAREKNIGRFPTAAIVLALFAPWALALFPEPLRWPAQVIGIPLAWALVWFVLYLPPNRGDDFV